MENTNPTIENLRSNSLFKYISDNDLLNISKTLKEETFSAGTIIFNEKTRGERLYLILEGKVKISKVTKSGMETQLAILGKDNFFGEMEIRRFACGNLYWKRTIYPCFITRQKNPHRLPVDGLLY